MLAKSQLGPNPFRIVGDSAAIILTDKRGRATGETLVSLADIDRTLSAGRWFLSHSDKRRGGQRLPREFYPHAAAHNGPGFTPRKVLLHRFLLLPDANVEVDHINHDTLDNRRENLRLVNKSQNQQNIGGSHCDSKSGVRNVYWQEQTQRWMVQVCINYKRHTYGSFKTIEEAAAIAEAARKMHHSHCPENSISEVTT